MRIAWVIDNLKLVGGAQRVLILFAKTLQNTNHQLTVVCLREYPGSPVPEQLQRLGARVVTFHGKNLRDPGRFVKLLRFFKQEKFDVIHTHLTYANILGTLAGRYAGTPVIASLHNSRLDTGNYHRFVNGTEAFLLKNFAQAIMAVGYTTAEAHAARLGNRKIDVIPLAVEIPPAISPERRVELRKEMAGDPERIIVITVGRLTQQKSYHHLIRAFELLKNKHPEASLVFVGSGKLLEDLQSQARSAGLADRVNFLGPRVDVPDLLDASDLYVNSSLWEGLPCTILEGMAAGLPVVATDVGDSARAVTKEAGLIVPPAQPELLSEALSSLLSQAELRQQMGVAAKVHVSRKYALGPWSERLLDLYESVLPIQGVSEAPASK